MKRILKELGFKRGWIYEVIVETKGHAAPMGIWTDDFETTRMDIYKTSQTYRNILKEGRFTINFVDEIELFFDSIVCKKIKSRSVNVRLGVEVQNTTDLGNKVNFTLEIVSHKIKRSVTLINRAKYLTLESLIEYTKPRPSARKIKGNFEKIKKVAPKSAYEKILIELLKFHHSPQD